MASGVEAKLLKSTKFPPEYSKKVDMTKVNVEVMKQCVAPLTPSSRIALQAGADLARNSQMDRAEGG